MKNSNDIINQSGYPLQIYLEDQINKTQNTHGWRVLVSEHRWTNSETNEEGFIDLILEKFNSPVKLILECKRVDGTWTFLLPSATPNSVYSIRILNSQFLQSTLCVWSDEQIKPASYEARYCVLDTGGKKDSRTLEKLAGDLLLSTESIAFEEMDLRKELTSGWNTRYYLPIIVTTAKLKVSIFNSQDIDSETGTILTSKISEIEYIRFRKNLATNLAHELKGISDLKGINFNNERTVFIVQASRFINFLSQFHDR